MVADHADRLADRKHVHPFALARHQVAGQPRTFAAEIPEDVDRPPHFALGFRQRLALFPAHLLAQLIELLFQDVGDLEQQRPARRPGHVRPAGERGLGRFRRTVYVRRGPFHE